MKFILLAVGCTLLSLHSTPVHAQENQDAITRAIEETRAELATERARITAEENELDSRLQALIEERKSLTDSFVDLELEIDQMEVDFRELQNKRVMKRNAVESLRLTQTDLPRLLREAGSKLEDLLEVLPPREPGLSAGQLGVSSIDELVQTLERLLAASRGHAIFRENLVLPDGSQAEAEVLRLGLVAWYYRIGASDRVGLAMNAPGADEAYRWLEDLAPKTKSDLRSALGNVFSGAATSAALPLDVTVQMESESTIREKTAWSTVLAGGPVIIPLAGVAILALLMILERALMLFRTGFFTSSLGEKIINEVRTGSFDAALAVCKKRDVPLTRTLRAAIESRHRGVEAMEESVQATVLTELPRLERFLPTIAMLASIAPLLGLLGTVTGMIVTFEMIATLGSGNPRIMAGGISQALITTAAGLVVAIPILLCHSFLATRVDRLIADMERYAATLLNVMRKES